MENGRITQQGTYNELLGDGTPFEKLINAHHSSITVFEKSNLSNFASTEQEPDVYVGNKHRPTTEQSGEKEIIIAKKSTKNISTQLTEEEEKEIGDFGWKPYKDYLSVSKGKSLLGFLICAQVLFMGMQSMSTYWLAIAVQFSHIGSEVLVGVYAVFSTVSCVFSYFRSYCAAQLGLKASKTFFDGFMNCIFKAPMVFFDSTPVGRILTRVYFFVFCS
jgi:ATP-binding cassette, subfamily C (CFTR/MRP), member 1